MTIERNTKTFPFIGLYLKKEVNDSLMAIFPYKRQSCQISQAKGPWDLSNMHVRKGIQPTMILHIV